jgi:PIN domain nuclease of toxin-antitoxin system
MKLLLDTQAWLWMISQSERLSREARARLFDPGTELYLSAASVWEIAIKSSIGKVRFPGPIGAYVPSALERSGVRSLAVDSRHALRTAELPMHHRDPFDRLLVAQAQLEGMAIVTADRRFSAYEVELLDA